LQKKLVSGHKKYQIAHSMRIVFITLFGFYFLLGAVCLPGGNFALVGQLPKMYAECKAHEDKDMNLIDFVTDHLICIDAIFDSHQGNDEQKPHEANLAGNQNFQPLFFQIFNCQLPLNMPEILNNKIFPIWENQYVFECLKVCFRPPVVNHFRHFYS